MQREKKILKILNENPLLAASAAGDELTKMESDFFKAYKYIIRKIITSDGIENLTYKEKKKILKILNENPLIAS
jgi:hypothetical protein